MYKSPIKLEIREIARKMVEEQDAVIMHEVHKVVPTVDEDELIRALKYDREQYEKGYWDGKQEAEKLRTVEWIPVTERLPEENGMYIVSAFDGHDRRITFAQWQNRLKRWYLTGARSYWKVTHWMPLPEPPKENCNASDL